MEKNRFTVSQMFSDHMVLQRNKKINLWGTGIEGKTIQAKIEGQNVETKVADGRWSLQLEPMTAGGPYELQVICDGETRIFRDVLVGEVWLAGGQSNMELELINSDDGANQVKAADHELLRFYNVVKTGALTDEVLAQQEKQLWKVCTPEQAGDVSAVAYFCARRLQQELQVPVGVIDCYIGGTSVTCWMDNDTLNRTEEGRGYIKRYAEQIGDKTEEEYQAEMAEYNRQWKTWDDGVQAERAKNPDVTWEYLNEHVGICPWPQPAGLTSNFRPTNPYYGMMERVIPYTLRGFWYYQGEEDTYLPETYGILMESLIRCWREKWREADAPFVLTQLPMYIANHEADDRNWARLREQQAKIAEQIPNTYMNVLIDCGEFDNIHPTDKLTVGDRMAALCLEHVYGRPCHADGPKMQTVAGEDAQVRVTFSGQPLQVKGTEIALFELAGADEAYYPAQAELCGEHEVIVRSAEVSAPQYVRYAYVNFGQVTLFDLYGLPAAPFRRKL